ncbi:MULTISPECIES: gamma carbonic anhydrase family protein [Neisseria]|uniref:Gamma carbonic anhydrase family protein n=1 Tax=Neisseria zoodegmatis TaxID=326523 RepID=A0AB38DPT6_9NEIS|nr:MULTISPECIES: gamma carbonic anhydrase family protein [Neisseria]OSI09973.1 gamma carbonic anhydrase family protein [Neisseria zoodegmatis]OSI15057.1 gamma carbonic anhydrase family protein [Neisseria dumasiana]SNU79013.1 putative transferase [Neisseria zoodegmatis]
MNIRPYLEHVPHIDESCYIDPVSAVIGEVSLAQDVSVWPFAVLRGDVNSITIGARSNVQDLSMLHVSHKTAAKPDGSPLVIGEDVTIGHKVMLHGCTIGNRVLVGMNTVILDDVVIEDDVMIGAGSLVPPRKRLESGFLYVGSPVKQVRPLTDDEKAFLVYSAQHYMRVAANHKKTLAEMPSENAASADCNT